MRAWDTGRRIINGLAEIPIPVIFAVQGDVMGLGATTVLSGDVIVASRNVRIGDPHVMVGLVAGDGGCLVWPAAFGMVQAKRHLLTGDPISAEDAHMLGGVTDLVETPEEEVPLAEKIAGKLAALPPMAVQFTKRAFNHATRRNAADVFEFSLVLEQYGLLSEDVLEAVAAFREKRRPVYKNR
jgi:enoyl-CoA hydratase